VLFNVTILAAFAAILLLAAVKSVDSLLIYSVCCVLRVIMSPILPAAVSKFETLVVKAPILVLLVPT
jgi:hypothetical protein